MTRHTIYFIALILAFSSCQQKEKTYSFENPSMEQLKEGKPVAWDSLGWEAPARHLVSEQARSGSRSVSITSDTASGGSWSTRIALKPYTEYRFTAWVKTKDLKPVGDRGRGASIGLSTMDVDRQFFTGTQNWQKVEYTFETGWNDGARVSLNFGSGGPSTGTVWMDDVHLEELSSREMDPQVTADVLQTKADSMPVYIYGQFIEHLGRCIYGGIWAEMLEDRKFYYPVGHEHSPWKSLASEQTVAMSSESSFVGDHTPVVSPAGKGAGILQEEVGMRADMTYSGRIHLKANPGIQEVEVILDWQSGADTVHIKNLTPAYKEYPLRFKAGATTLEGRFKVRGYGDGTFHIGTLSLMPDDNVHGFRADVLEKLRQLNSPVYRWPGGNFVSGYNWKDGIGERDKRPPRKNPAWTGVEHNDVGIHEFMQLCELLNTEPYIAVNAGEGKAKQARQELEYTNGDVTTPMGQLRARNGHPEPWNVKWWAVGNEMYGDWQLGHMPTEEFVRKHNEFAEKMRSMDPSVNLVAVGNVGEWDEMILSHSADNMDYISEHFYRQDWHGGGVITHTRQVPDAISHIAEAHRIYRDTIPELQGKDIRICMDEWNYWYGPHVYGELGTRYFQKDALGIAAGIHEYSRNSDIIYMANYAQTVNVIGAIKTNDITSSFATTGLVLKLYRDQFGTWPVQIDQTYRPLDVAATLTLNKDTLTLGVVNPTDQSWEVPLDLKNTTPAGDATQWIISGPDAEAYNEPGKEPNVTIQGPKKLNHAKSFSMPALSAGIVRIPLKK